MRLRLLTLPLAAALAGCPSPSTSDQPPDEQLAAILTRLPDERLLLELTDPLARGGEGETSTTADKTSKVTKPVDTTTTRTSSGLEVTYEIEAEDDSEAEEVESRDTEATPLRGSGQSLTGATVDLWVLEDPDAGVADWLMLWSQDGQMIDAVRGTARTDVPEGSIEGTMTNVLGDAALVFPSLDEVVPPSGRVDPSEAVAVDFSGDGQTSTLSATIDLPDDTFDRARVFEATTDADGGVIDLVLRADVVGDSSPELLAVRVQWSKELGGRGDASVCEEPCTDLATDLLGTLSDCFDGDGITTWSSRSWNGNTSGNANACIFTESLPDQSVVDSLVE
ncbi:MAG: hypothetical protein KDA24_03940 [Deltaproteobacteria bacterium]|nr:hypothetical protein [Deltaproteobacteria bacterium]